MAGGSTKSALSGLVEQRAEECARGKRKGGGKGCAWGVEGRMMPPVLLHFLRSFCSFFLPSPPSPSFSFLPSTPSSHLRYPSTLFSLSYPFAEHPPSMGKQRRSNVCRCTKLAWILHGDALERPETACEIRDMCRTVRTFAISFASFCSRFHSRLFVVLNLDCVPCVAQSI